MLDTHPEYTIYTIAETCGFPYRTFYRLFKEHYHINASEYRKIANYQKNSIKN